jgi:hypothetical protein
VKLIAGFILSAVKKEERSVRGSSQYIKKLHFESTTANSRSREATFYRNKNVAGVPEIFSSSQNGILVL